MTREKTGKKRKSKKAQTPYPVYTGQETKAALIAISDGKSGRNWENNESLYARVHQSKGTQHFVRLALTEDERRSGLTLQNLEEITGARDADEDFMLLYITRLLLPAQPLPDSTRAAAEIDLDDVIQAVGWNPLSTQERLQMRRRVWEFIKFASRLEIDGERSGTYYDRESGKEIETRISSAPWNIEEKTLPMSQLSLFEGYEEVPLTVSLVATRMWTELTSRPAVSQFLPLGEILGAIPGGKPAGAWARVIGLALSDFWRRQPRAALTGFIKPTRRELLEFCTPKTGAVSDVFETPNPRRVLEYWVNALQILVKNGFLENSGEAALSFEAQREALPRYRWQETWMDSLVELRPGPAMQDAVQKCAVALPEPKPHILKKSRRKTQA